MNIDNIVSLTVLLQEIGLDSNIGKKLLQKICFRPAAFELRERILIEKDLLTCSFLFQRVKQEYVCSYYDASLLKSIDYPEQNIQSIDIRELDNRMSKVDWKFFYKQTDFNASDPVSFEKETEIEKIVTELSELSDSAEGKFFADYLSVKHSNEFSVLAANQLTSLRARFEISQRFHFIEGKGIGISEAYRFLINRWIEKRLSRKRLLPSALNQVLAHNDGNADNEKNILIKKRNRRKKSKG